MKARRWVLVVLAGIILVGLCWYYGAQWMKINQRARAFLLQKVTPLMGKNFAVDEVQLGIGSIRLKVVWTRLGEWPCILYAKDIRIRYSLFFFLSPKISQGVLEIYN